MAKNWDRKRREREREGERERELSDQRNTEHDGTVVVCMSMSHKHLFALYARKLNVQSFLLFILFGE